MKNSTLEQRSVVKSLLLIIILSLAFASANAQLPYLSVQVTRDITGSGLGGNVNPTIAICKNRHSISIGPNFQRKRMNLSGIQMNYRYMLGQSLNQRFGIYSSANLTYHHAARMSEGYIEIEKSCNKENPCDYTKLRLEVIESYAGFGIQYNSKLNLSARAGIGIGMFYTMNKDYDREMFREKQSMALRMNISLIYNIKK